MKLLYVILYFLLYTLNFSCTQSTSSEVANSTEETSEDDKTTSTDEITSSPDPDPEETDEMPVEIPDQWTLLHENDNYTARHECSFVQAGDQFYFFGGREKATRLEIYDYQNNSWSIGSEAPKEFNHFQATFYKGFIWVIGAFKTNKFPREEPEENVWLYHPPSDQWIKGPEIPEGRRRGGAGLTIYQDKFYLVGGNTEGHNGGYVNWFDAYDPWTNSWVELSNAGEARDHFFAAVIGDKLFAAGGRKSGGDGGVFAPLVSPVDQYDFTEQKWSSLDQNIPTPRAAPGTSVFNGELLLIGGEGEKSGPAYQIVEAYDPLTNTWSEKSNMNFPRHGAQTIVSGHGVYITGGSPKRGGGNQKNMEVYGLNMPEGKSITPSVLVGPDRVGMRNDQETIIILTNQGGTSASFVTSVTIESDNPDAFELLEDVQHRLINENGDLELKVRCNQELASANLIISYNGNQENIIFLVSS